MSTEYATILRIGEKRRDATDTIKGYLYQDYLAIDIILKSLDDEKIGVEWVEDIFVESPSKISIYQVKHYPKTESLDMQPVYENMFYQFLKYSLYKQDNKEIKTYCLYNAKKINKYCKELIQTKINENDFDKINLPVIKEQLENCANMKERIDLLFTNVANNNLLDSLYFEPTEKDDIGDVRDELKIALSTLFQSAITSDVLLNSLDKNSINDLLLALAIKYVQDSYIKNIEPEQYSTRYLTKKGLVDFISIIFVPNEENRSKILESIVLGYIDELFSDVIVEITLKQNIEKYYELYLSTKQFIASIFSEKRKRFMFINSISTDGIKCLNWESYSKINYPERDKIIENKNNIKSVIRMTWKILYDIDCTNYSQFIVENEDCFFFDIDDERAKHILIISSNPGQSVRDVKNILPRIASMKVRPDKWYLCCGLNDYYEYSFKVNKISDIKVNRADSVYYKENNLFKIECMNCVKYDSEAMEDKDYPELSKCLFLPDCIKGE